MFLAIVISFVGGVLVGAYGHKYLAREEAAAQAAVSSAASNAAKTFAGDTAPAAKK